MAVLRIVNEAPLKEKHTQFQAIKNAAVSDARGRVTIGSEAVGKQYRVYKNERGQILLDPIIEISATEFSEREKHLLSDKQKAKTWDKATQDVEIGKVVDKGSFASYVE